MYIQGMALLSHSSGFTAPAHALGLVEIPVLKIIKKPLGSLHGQSVLPFSPRLCSK